MSHGMSHISRRRFLQAGLAFAASGVIGGCSGRLQEQVKAGGTATARASSNVGAVKSGTPATLKILQWTHFVPAYNDWFVKEYARAWGEKNGAQVTVDLVAMDRVPIPAAAEAAQQKGHDLICFPCPPAAFEEQLLDVSDVAKELESKVGPMTSMARAGTYNPKTGKVFGISDHWVPAPIHWRTDQWEAAEPGSQPDTWDDLLRVGRKLKQMKAPLGIGFSADLDSVTAMQALLLSFGGSVQDSNGQVVINSRQTIEAVKFGVALFRETTSPEMLAWSASSNNAFIAARAGSLIFNGLSALRAAEKSDPELARNMLLARTPAGPAGRRTPPNIMGTYTIWKFAEQPDLARRFLIDLITNYATAFEKSQLYNLPSWPGTVPNFKTRVANDPAADPKNKYAILDGAEQWVVNYGYPGADSAVASEATSSFIVPRMFAIAARGQLSPEEAVRWAESQLVSMSERWRSRGLI